MNRKNSKLGSQTKHIHGRMKYLHRYLHVYSRKGRHPQDEMLRHEATKYAHNEQVPLTKLPCLGKNLNSG